MLSGSPFARYCALVAAHCNFHGIARSSEWRQRVKARRRGGNGVRLLAAIEPLEERIVLSPVFQVTSSADDGSVGTLRYAIDQANQSGNPSAEVEIVAGSGPIHLTGGELQILADMSIVDDSGSPVEIQQNTPGARVFDIGPNALNVSIGSGGGSNILIDGGQALGGNGGGILVEGANSQLTLTNVDIEGNSAVAVHGVGGNGGGIYSGGSVSLIDSTVGTNGPANTASLIGGGIWAQEGVSLDASSVNGNQAALNISSAGKGGGGGIFVDDGGVTLADGSSVSGNSALYGEGGGISVAAGYVDVSGASHVDSNSAQDVGGILVGAIDTSLNHGSNAVSVIGNSTVNANSSTAGQHQNAQNLGGGGIAAETTGNVYIDASQVNNNSTVGMYSGGILLGLGKHTVTNYSQVDGNSNNGPGGGIAANFGGTVTVTDHSQVNGNTGAALGGGIVNFAGPKGAINVTGDSEVDNNTLTNGETIGRVILVAIETALSAQGNNFSTFATAAGGSGGAAMLKALKLEKAAAMAIQETLQAAALQISISHPFGVVVGGGGIASLAAPVTVSGGSEVNGNIVGQNVLGNNHTVVGLGGGIFSIANLGGVTIDDSQVNNNQAPVGDGGGIWLGRGSATITDGSSIDGNSASGNGGGIYSKGRLRIQQSSVSNNTAGKQGGGVYNAGSLVKVGATITGNSPNNIFP